jgi:hypothetical protein
MQAPTIEFEKSWELIQDGSYILDMLGPETSSYVKIWGIGENFLPHKKAMSSCP